MNTGMLRQLVTLDMPLVDGVQPLSPATWYCAVRDEGAGTAIVTGRYHPGITRLTRIHLKGRVYHVDAVRNRDERDAELELTCHEVFE